jgi:hypothetical protein
MGGTEFEKLKAGIVAANLSGFKGEPDLFCWHPGTREGFFAEAKGDDHLLPSQYDWFRVCRNTLPSVDIKVYRLMAAKS